MDMHPWDVTPKEARQIQEQLRDRVVISDRFEAVRYVGGADVGYEKKGRITRAAVVVLSFPTLELLDYRIVRMPTAFPYVPGLLSFREAPALLAALAALDKVPDLLLCDGQGVAHPRRFGIACHIGVLTGIPAIGVAKTRLVGEHPSVPSEKGGQVPLTDRGELIGAVMRTRTGVKPVFVSPGHNISLNSAVSYVMACVTRYRLPETTRWAHRLASGGEPIAQGRPVGL